MYYRRRPIPRPTVSSGGSVMTDREMLELAARAAGILYTISPHGNLMAHRHPAGGEMRVWNPLSDDGDALRLATKLRIDILYRDQGVIVKGEAQQLSGFYPYGDDIQATLRRAVVTEASVIGRA